MMHETVGKYTYIDTFCLDWSDMQSEYKQKHVGKNGELKEAAG